MKFLSILFLVLSIFSAPSFSADVTSEPMQITKIMTTNGDAFIIFFDKEVSPSCHYNGTNSVYYYANQIGVKISAVKQALSVALTGLTTGMLVSVTYNNSTKECWSKYLTIHKN